MKYIKSYRIFESSISIDEFKDEINDILVDVSDLNYIISITDKKYNSFLHRGMENQEIQVYIEIPQGLYNDYKFLPNYKTLPKDDEVIIIDSLERLIDYSINNLFTYSIYTYKDGMLLSIIDNPQEIEYTIEKTDFDSIKIVLQRKVNSVVNGLFESDSYSDIKANCEDILLDFSDNRIKVVVSYYPKKKSSDFYLRIIIDPYKLIKLSEFKDTIERLMSYLNNEGLKLSSKSYCLNETWDASECCPNCRSQSIIMKDENIDDLMCNNCNFSGNTEDFLTDEHPIKDDISWFLDKNYYISFLSLVFEK